MSWWTPGIWNFIPYGVLSMADLQYRLHWHQWNKKNRQKEHTVPQMLEFARPGLPQLRVLGPDASYLGKPSKLLTGFSRGGTWHVLGSKPPCTHTAFTHPTGEGCRRRLGGPQWEFEGQELLLGQGHGWYEGCWSELSGGLPRAGKQHDHANRPKHTLFP